jgi:hypothetical protein
LNPSASDIACRGSICSINRAQFLAFVDDPEVPDNPLSEGWRFETVGCTIIERFYVP